MRDSKLSGANLTPAQSSGMGVLPFLLGPTESSSRPKHRAESASLLQPSGRHEGLLLLVDL